LGGDCKTDEVVKVPMLHELFDLLGFPDRNTYSDSETSLRSAVNIDEKNNNETREIIRELGGEAHAYRVDVSSREQIYQIAERVKAEVGEVDLLFNNAGVVYGRKLMDSPDELIEKTLAINTLSLFWTTKAFLPRMLEQREGHVIVLASILGHCGLTRLVDYCTSKYGAVGFCDALRAELGSESGVHVTAICPFAINTGMFKGAVSYTPSLFPILEPEFVTGRIVEAVLTEAENLFTPKSCFLHLFLKGILPSSVTLLMFDYFGLNRGMDTFVGRHIAK